MICNPGRGVPDLPVRRQAGNPAGRRKLPPVKTGSPMRGRIFQQPPKHDQTHRFPVRQPVHPSCHCRISGAFNLRIGRKNRAGRKSVPRLAQNFLCAARRIFIGSFRNPAEKPGNPCPTHHRRNGQAHPRSPRRSGKMHHRVRLLRPRSRKTAGRPARRHAVPQPSCVRPHRRRIRNHALEFSVLAGIPPGGGLAHGGQRAAAQARPERERLLAGH